MSISYKKAFDVWQEIWFQYILDNLNLPWNWFNLSRNENVTWELIQKYPNLPWDYQGLSGNPNITLKIIKENSHKKWFWQDISDIVS